MSIAHFLGKPVHAMDYGNIFDCNTGNGGSTSGGAINGDIVDRLALGRHFHVAIPVLHGHGLASTAANKKVQVDAKLQHGDESDGSDMADYSTGYQPATITHGSSAETTPMALWSTGPGDYNSGYVAYDMRAAKRYIRMVGTITMPGNTTSTAAAQSVQYAGAIVFGGGDENPPLNTSTGVNSTATST